MKAIDNFFQWLSDEAKGMSVLGYIIFAALVVVSVDYTVRAALINWHFVDAPPVPKLGDSPFKYSNAFEFISMFVWGPIKEEIIFRVLPFSFLIAFVTNSPRVLFMVATLFAAVFGAVHPYGAMGRVDVAISGFFFGLVFLKCGGLNKVFVKASVCAVAVHGLSNVFTVLDAWWEYFEAVR